MVWISLDFSLQAQFIRFLRIALGHITIHKVAGQAPGKLSASEASFHRGPLLMDLWNSVAWLPMATSLFVWPFFLVQHKDLLNRKFVVFSFTVVPQPRYSLQDRTHCRENYMASYAPLTIKVIITGCTFFSSLFHMDGSLGLMLIKTDERWCQRMDWSLDACNCGVKRSTQTPGTRACYETNTFLFSSTRGLDTSVCSHTIKKTKLLPCSRSPLGLEPMHTA